VVHPGNQQLSSLQDFIAWREIVQDYVIIDLLEKHFFPRWLNVLAFWVKTTKQQAQQTQELTTTLQQRLSILPQVEMLVWYKGWKKFFREQDLLYPSVIVQLDRALHFLFVSFIDHNSTN